MHKLNIIPPDPIIPPVPQKTGYESPIGLWEVFGVFGEEAGEQRNLGHHYGHVAAIAFELADKAGWQLIFKPVITPYITNGETKEGERARKAAKRDIWIKLDSLHYQHGDNRWLKHWLDLDSNQVEVRSSYAGQNLYRSVCLLLK